MRTNIHIETWECSPLDKVAIFPGETVTVEIDYPLERPRTFKIHGGKTGKSYIAVVNAIVRKYREIYKDDETNKSNNVCGHDIGDLYLEDIKVDHRTKKVRIFVGS